MTGVEASAAEGDGERGHGAADDLRQWLAERLPEPMIPAAFVALPELPRTPNDKLDRRALPAPGSQRPPRGSPSNPPRTPTEEAIAAIWRAVLLRDPIGVHDNFFEVGGSSLLLLKLQSRLRHALGCEITMVQLLSHPTIHALSGLLAQEQEAPPPATAGRTARAL
jgi:aryl carrier-like protein